MAQIIGKLLMMPRPHQNDLLAEILEGKINVYLFPCKLYWCVLFKLRIHRCRKEKKIFHVCGFSLFQLFCGNGSFFFPPAYRWNVIVSRNSFFFFFFSLYIYILSVLWFNRDQTLPRQRCIIDSIDVLNLFLFIFYRGNIWA